MTENAISKSTKDATKSEVTLRKARYENFANCNKKNPFKLHVVDVDDFK